MQIRHLEQAERNVAEGERHIAEQEERVVQLARGGHNVTEARKLLDNFYASQALHIQHRDRIRKELVR
ncbi:MAG: hypothetical protein KGK01_06660 [Bradyrhizobium sp.]|nr:hypothetical protein [Pseudomonadota bacterium]MDE2069157.1 hypothetical protein [Bradyrhizobium sp.]MDE2242121.1 hypothetical protein [Bradyrhizobium sp.]MDE2468936.1 hypothetical protein [Bradyrhizobium sp.]